MKSTLCESSVVEWLYCVSSPYTDAPLSTPINYFSIRCHLFIFTSQSRYRLQIKSFLFSLKVKTKKQRIDRYTKRLLSFALGWQIIRKKQSPFVPSQIKSRNFSSSLFIGFNAKNVHLVLESFQEETIINHQQNVSRLTFRLWYKKGGKWS